MTTEKSDSIANDILSGAEEIGAYVGLSERLAWHYLETGALPAFKLRGKWTTTKTRIRTHYNTAQYVPKAKDDEKSSDSAIDTTSLPKRGRRHHPRGVGGRARHHATR